MAHKRDITTGNILASAAGGIASTFVLASFGATGSLIGAGLGPVVFLIVKEFTRGPTDSVATRRVASASLTTTAGIPTGEPAVKRTPFQLVRRRPRPRVIAITAVLATLLTVAAVTLPELILGSSLVSDRRTTILSPASHTPSAPEKTPAATPPAADTEDAAPAGAGTTTQEAPPAEITPPATTTPGTTTTAPADPNATQTGPQPADQQAPPTQQPAESAPPAAQPPAATPPPAQ